MCPDAFDNGFLSWRKLSGTLPNQLHGLHCQMIFHGFLFVYNNNTTNDEQDWLHIDVYVLNRPSSQIRYSVWPVSRTLSFFAKAEVELTDDPALWIRYLC